MSRSLPNGVSPTPPGKIQGTISDSHSGQLALDLRTYLEHREIVYAALRHGVEDGFAKQGEFADEVGKSNQEVNLRLRHSDDSKGYPQLAPVDYVARIGTRPVARETFLRDLAAAWGFRLVPLAPPTDAEKWSAVASEMTDKQRRRLERERGWPEGTLG